MLWNSGRRSTNVEDRRVMRIGPTLIGGGLGSIVLVLIGLFMGIDPRSIVDSPDDQASNTPAALYDSTQELRDRFHAPGDFAQAYVISHEIGHHVQNLLHISDQVEAFQDRSSKTEANQASVRLELQADCFAGVWAANTEKKEQAQGHGFLESGDVAEALQAASMIGDDKLQMQAQGYVVPESFTHGTAAQRMQWFKRGFSSATISGCNTFQ